MITYSGRSVWPSWTAQPGVPLDVGPSLEDIAVGLGRQSRFAGQTREFYTVLCHSLVAAQVARHFWSEDWGLKNVLLLHDAHESCISDVPTTWKNHMTREDEQELDRRIWLEFNLPDLNPDLDLTKRMKQVDAACLAAEAHVLGHVEAERWWPRGGFSELDEQAFKLTEASLRAGNPIRFLEPRNAIDALRAALR